MNRHEGVDAKTTRVAASGSNGHGQSDAQAEAEARAVAQAEAEALALKARLIRAERRLARANETLARLPHLHHRVAELESRQAADKAHREHLEELVRGYEGSTSWKLTRPFRALGRLARRARSAQP